MSKINEQIESMNHKINDIATFIGVYMSVKILLTLW
jgi:hypothetical protein